MPVRRLCPSGQLTLWWRTVSTLNTHLHHCSPVPALTHHSHAPVTSGPVDQYPVAYLLASQCPVQSCIPTPCVLPAPSDHHRAHRALRTHSCLQAAGTAHIHTTHTRILNSDHPSCFSTSTTDHRPRDRPTVQQSTHDPSPLTHSTLTRTHPPSSSPLFVYDQRPPTSTSKRLPQSPSPRPPPSSLTPTPSLLRPSLSFSLVHPARSAPTRNELLHFGAPNHTDISSHDAPSLDTPHDVFLGKKAGRWLPGSRV